MPRSHALACRGIFGAGVCLNEHFSNGEKGNVKIMNIYIYNIISHIQRSPGAKQRRGGLAPLSAPEQILRSLAREQRHLAYLERWIWGRPTGQNSRPLICHTHEYPQ